MTFSSLRVGGAEGPSGAKKAYVLASAATAGAWHDFDSCSRALNLLGYQINRYHPCFCCPYVMSPQAESWGGFYPRDPIASFTVCFYWPFCALQAEVNASLQEDNKTAYFGLIT